jgi:ribonuclease P protein component
MTGRPSPVRGREVFRSLVRSSRRARSGPVTVHFLSVEEPEGEVLVAYSVGRKVGGAVVRNRWRRRLRAIAAEAAPELPPGAYLLGVGPDIRGLHFDELRERVIDTMYRASGRQP